jgi:hypothetical protein
MQQFLQHVAGSMGYRIDWDEAASQLHGPNARILQRWLRTGIALTALDLRRDLLNREWTGMRRGVTIYTLDDTLADCATRVRAVSSDWLDTDKEWQTLYAGFQHLGEQLDLFQPLNQAHHTPITDAGTPDGNGSSHL